MIDQNSIAYLAALARLDLPEAESEALRQDMESIIALMDSLQEVDMGNAEHRPDGISPSALREDAAAQTLEPELFLEQAPGGAADGFTIPRMLE